MLKDIFEKIENMNYEDALEILQEIYPIRQQSYIDKVSMLLDNYLVRLDDDNWICHTSKILEIPEDEEYEELRVKASWWILRYEGEYYYSEKRE